MSNSSSSYLDLSPLTDEQQMLKAEAHRIAAEVLRPAAEKLDRMEPSERVEEGSPFFHAMARLKSLGYHRLFMPDSYGGPDGADAAISQAIVLEELGWGSLGLATSFLVDLLPFRAIAELGSETAKEDLLAPWLEDSEATTHGCWAITEPDHGSDFLAGLRDGEGRSFGRAQLLATRSEGGPEPGWTLKGQKSAWVSSGPVATHAAVHAQVDTGSSLGESLFAVVDLRQEGIRKGRPVDMLGVRDEPQGEIFFDNAWVPDSAVLVPSGPFYAVFGDQLLCVTSSAISNVAVGVARAAFEEALDYARSRIQGGMPIASHKNIALTLYSMFEKIETARSYSRSALAHVTSSLSFSGSAISGASPRHTRAAQIFAKRIAFEVANDAVQVLGAIGLSREHPVEKLFRDARSLWIEDGTLEVLSLDAARDVIANYENQSYDFEEVMARW